MKKITKGNGYYEIVMERGERTLLENSELLIMLDKLISN